MKKLIYTSLFLLLGIGAQAQLKVGSNPTTITPNKNFEVEATNGRKVNVNKVDGRTNVENTPSALPTDSIIFRGSDGELRQMSISRFMSLQAPAAASVSGITCGGASASPATFSAGTPYSGTITVPYTGGNGLAYPAGAANTVNGITYTLQAGTLTNNLGGNLTYAVSGTPTASGTSQLPVSFTGAATCNVAVPVGVGAASVSGITCGSASASPATFTAGTPYSGTVTVPYTGGNGLAYPAGAANTVNGITYTLQAGTLTNNLGGNLTYAVSGTPIASGTSQLPVSFAGAATCNVAVPVGVASGTIAAIDCPNTTYSSDGFIVGEAIPANSTISVPYTGGNGVAYSAGSPATVNGIIYTLQAGTLANGTGGNFVYALSGTPTVQGTNTLPVSVLGVSCNIAMEISAVPTPINSEVGRGGYAVSTERCYCVSASNALPNPWPSQGVTGLNRATRFIASAGCIVGGATGLTRPPVGYICVKTSPDLNSSGNDTGNYSGTPSGSGTARWLIRDIDGKIIQLAHDVIVP